MTRSYKNDVDWSQAVCLKVDPDIFFTPDTEQIAVALCHTCVIRFECLDYAISRKIEHGVWGAMTEKTRHNVKFPRHRVRCPGCGSFEVSVGGHRVEVCYGCGLSWPI